MFSHQWAFSEGSWGRSYLIILFIVRIIRASIISNDVLLLFSSTWFPFFPPAKCSERLLLEMKTRRNGQIKERRRRKTKEKDIADIVYIIDRAAATVACVIHSAPAIATTSETRQYPGNKYALVDSYIELSSFHPFFFVCLFVCLCEYRKKETFQKKSNFIQIFIQFQTSTSFLFQFLR